MINFGIEGVKLTDKSFHVFANMPKLSYLWLSGNKDITGSLLTAVADSKINTINFDNTSLNDNSLFAAAKIKRLSSITIDNTNVSFEGLMNIAWNQKIKVYAKNIFTKEQIEMFVSEQRNYGKKKQTITIDEKSVETAKNVLLSFFDEMTKWEILVPKKDADDKELCYLIDNIFNNFVCEKPRKGYRPSSRGYSEGGTYSCYKIIDIEEVSKNKLYLYTKDEKGMEEHCRFCLRLTGGKCKIEYAQNHIDGWKRVGL